MSVKFIIRAAVMIMIASALIIVTALVFPLPDKAGPACCSADTCSREGHHK
jgi:hypothetical protein